MFAINHAATALIIKKEFINVPIIWVLISVQFMEILWVLLNFLGVERTTTEKEVRYVGDVHLSFMPFSHSMVTMIGVALLAWLIISKGLGLPEAGIAVGIGVISHLILDLITHSSDIAIAPFIKSPKFGLGLYAKYPIVASCWDWVRHFLLDLQGINSPSPQSLYSLQRISRCFLTDGYREHMAN
jgi:hypothetical protein